MKIKQQMHSALIKSLQAISKKIGDSLVSEKEKVSAVKELQELLYEQPLARQIVENCKYKTQRSKAEQKRAEKILLRKYEVYEAFMLKESSCPNIVYCLNTGKDLDQKPKNFSPFQWRTAGIKIALEDFFKYRAKSGLEILSSATDADKFFSNDPKVQYLEKVKKKICEIKSFQTSIEHIKAFTDGDESCSDLEVHALRVCEGCIAELFIAKELATLRIEKITYQYSFEGRNSTFVLWFFIGEEKCKFMGQRAVALRLAMLSPKTKHCLSRISGKDFDLLSTKKKADALDAGNKQINAINVILSNKFCHYGIFNFLIRERGKFQINEKFSELIKAK